ncbi:MAG: molybdopterin molybdotransferase MoeA [Alicyclobacillaceae bacterium]|nr:molybdopterin molybdotransferase MoeA [Alicyclobacillaceae bacterium]
MAGLDLEMVDVQEARRRCLERVKTLEAVRLPLAEAAGCFVARAPELPEDVPPFDRSVMDGYAVRSEDLAGASADSPVSLLVIEEVPAGGWPRQTVRRGTAVRTMTGAPLAPGADAVVRLEDVRMPAGSSGRAGERIELTAPVAPGESVQKRGADLSRGSTPVGAGERIGPGEAAVLATAGAWEVEVIRRPRVALLSTGDELKSGPGPLKEGQIRNSNGPMLASMVRLEGWEAEDLGQCPDSVELVAERVGNALKLFDVVVTTGAVSVGDYDVVPQAMERLGMEILFQRVAIRPGKPVTVGERDGRLWFALPGNPASVFVTAHLFLLPSLRKMAGAKQWDPGRTTAVLKGRPGGGTVPLTRFWMGRVWLEEGRAVVDADREQSSSALSSFLGANALVDVPPGADPQPGDDVLVWWVGGSGRL